MFLLNVNVAGWAQDVPSPFVGTFSDGQITLVLQRGASGYTGQVQAGDETFPLQAQALPATQIQGTYTYRGQPMPFQAQLQGTTLTVTDTDGTVYALQRQGGAPPDRKAAGQSALAGSGEPGSSGEAGEIGDPSWGLHFMPPEGWTARPVEGGFLLGSNTLKGFILITPLEATTLDAVRTEAQQGLIDNQGTRLVLSGTLEPFGENGLAGDFTGAIEGQPARAHIVGLIAPHGSGATILGAVEPASYTPQHVQAVEAVARSIRFSVPEVAPLAAQWKTRFSGMRLTYMESYYSNGGGGYGGYSDKKEYDLCPDGTFAGQEKFNLNVDTGGAFGSARNNPGLRRGQWQIEAQGGQAMLQLIHPDGSVARFRLEDRGGKTYLDGQRWYVTNDATLCY